VPNWSPSKGSVKQAGNSIRPRKNLVGVCVGGGGGTDSITCVRRRFRKV
jgi:hypothetical protein